MASANLNAVNKLQSTAGPAPSAGTSPRVVLLEMFTGTWCTWCGVIKPAISRVLDEFGPDRLLMLAYHNGDTFTDTTLDTSRRAFYQQPFYGFPTTVIDGGGYTTGTSLFVVGSQGTTPSDYDFYKGKTVSELTKLTNIQLTLSGDLTSSTASITAKVYASDAITEMNLKIRFALYEDTLYATQTNGPPVHKYVVRTLVETAFAISQGQTLEFSHDFTPQPTWDKNRMGVVAFVQDDAKRSYACFGSYTCYNSPVIQAARYQYVVPNVLYVRDDDVTDMTVPPLRGEFVEAALSQANVPFDVYNTFDNMMDTGTNDVRGTPGLARMEEYGAVIWSTGPATSILTPANVADLGAYLDTYGDLFMIGENVATDLATNYPTFLSTYLHANHGTDPGPPAPTWMNGVAGDPITGAWSTTQLSFSGTSADNVDPATSAVTLLNYPGLVSAGVRATHDADSRVVTYGMNYFQGGDARKQTMVGNVLSWLDGAASPHVTLISPNGGESYSPGSQALVRWSAIDVKIPTDGIDIYYTTDLSNPNWVSVVTSEPNDGIYGWTVPNDDTANCGIKIVARDGDPATPDGIAISAGGCKIGAPNVSIRKQVSNPTPQVGELITYTITLTNIGSVDANATVTDPLPSPGVTYVSDDGHLTGTSSYITGTVTWNVIVPGKSSVTLHINATVDNGPAGTTVTNAATFQSSDMSGGNTQTGSSQVDFTIPNLIVWTLNLATGTRFASIPLLLVDYRVDVVLASIAGKYSYVRQYDPRDPVSPWKSYDPTRPYNSLHFLDSKMGFWIDMTQPGAITAVGARPASTTITLYAGWNMVAYPSLSTTYTIGDMQAALGAGSRAEGFDDTAAPYYLWRLPSNYVMKAGEGYWVYVPNTVAWVVTG